MTPPTARNSYDIVPYLARSHFSTHPDRLAVIATLLGMEPPPVTRARALELGCASGGNLLPMADSLPEATFTGVDLSARQIALGQAVVDDLGLKNLTLRQGSIQDVDPAFGQFDYILAHGVYAWVEPEVQDKLLSICRHNLAENGVAYVSYNTLPGWYHKLNVRDMMQHYTRQIDDPHARIRKSREMLNLVADLIAPMNAEQPVSAYGVAMRNEAELLKEQADDYLYHEYLEEVNTPIYVTDFVAQAERHGLQYLGDADRGLLALEALGEKVAAAIKQLHSGVVEQEQLLDFITNRTFRCTLLCHAEVQLNRSIGADRVKQLFVAANLKPPEGGPNLQTAELETFTNPAGDSTVGITQPVSKAALTILRAAWPRSLAFGELLAQACRAVYADPALADNKVVRAREAEALGLNLLKTHLHNGDLVAFHTYAPRLAFALPERPVASRSARYEALLGATVTTAYHQAIRLNDLAWQLLPFLDGTRDQTALVEVVTRNSAIVLDNDGQEVHDLDLKRAAAVPRVAECLELLRQLALIVEG